MPYPAHFDGRCFYNPGAPNARGFGDVLKWKLTTRPASSPRFVPVQTSVPPPSVDQPSLLVTMVNHATVLLQQPGCNILTDPIWSTHCGPLPGVGVPRRRAPGIEFDRLPPLHAVLISHNHFDHLDLPTLRRLVARGVKQFIAPLGVGRFLERHGILSVHELDWDGSIAIEGAIIHCVPAFHFSARGLFDRNRTLWCGYVIESAFGKVYFAADTAAGAHFGWIRERFGAPRLALLPIGAYEPRWFMKPIHMNPEDAVEAHRTLGAATSIAIHHGTFQLADESLDEPRRRLQACTPGDSFLILENGQSTLLT